MIGSLGEGAINKSAQADANAANIQMTRETNASNRQMQAEVNATNLAITRETNATNQEIAEKTNEFNAAQADKAYERSTASSKVAELIAAGMSPQQARMVVASNGLTGTATPATGTSIPAQSAQMQASKDVAPHVEPERFQGLAQGLGALGQGIDAMTNAYFGSFSAPDGGYVGAILSNDIYEKVSSQIGGIPANALSSAHSFQSWLSTQKEGYWHDIAASPDFQKMWSHPLGRRSFLYQLTQTYSESANTANSLLLQELEIRRNRLGELNDLLQNKITEQEFYMNFNRNAILLKQGEALDIENQRNSIVLERDKALADLVTQSETERLRHMIADERLRARLVSDPEYCDAWIQAQMSNQAFALAANTYAAMLYEGRNTWLQAHPQDAASLAVFSMFDELGMGNSVVFNDLKENYVAGGGLADYMAKIYDQSKSPDWIDGYYDNFMKPLWKKRADAGFAAERKKRWTEFGFKTLDAVEQLGVGIGTSRFGGQKDVMGAPPVLKSKDVLRPDGSKTHYDYQ